jgi:two-component system, NarL family, response regulator NreC
MIRIVVADDHALVRDGLRLLIAAEPDFEVVGEAGDGEEAVRLAQTLQPDLVLMDLTMPKKGGVQAIEEIKRANPKVRVLVLTMHDDQAYLRSVLAAGGDGYFVKQAAHSELIGAIRTVMRGRSYIGVSLGGGLREVADPAQAAGGRVGTAKLSGRELEVLTALAHGFTNSQIAKRMGVSVKSVETYRARLSDKLGFRHRADLVRYALEAGLLGPDAKPS